MTDPISKVHELIREEREFVAASPGWEITVFVPADAGEDLADKIMDAMADTAYELQPEDRNWDIFASATHNRMSIPVHLIEEALSD